MLTRAASERLAQLYGIDGQTAVVTGAASGIGRAVATLFAEAGANVACADIEPERLGAAVEAINEAAGKTVAVAVPTDISDEASVEALYGAASARPSDRSRSWPTSRAWRSGGASKSFPQPSTTARTRSILAACS